MFGKRSGESPFKGIMGRGKGFFDKTWDVAGKYIGEPMNKYAGKMGIEGVWPTTMDRECDKAARILRVFTLDGGIDTSATVEKLNVEDVDAKKKTAKVIKRIPAKALREAQGIAIFTVFRSGLGFSAASGSGIVIARKPNGQWGSPSGLLVHTVGFGFMLGIDVYDVVLLLRTKTAVESFARPKVNLGGELALVAGPLGSSVLADAGYQQAPAWSYVKSKGFYAGVQLDGSIIVERQDENSRFYGGKYTAKQILAGEVHTPVDVEGLLQTIEAASDRDTKVDQIPEGLAPSEATDGVLDTKEKEKAEIHQPVEGFGAPPQYEDLEIIEVKCSDCGTSMTMEQLAEHECTTTQIVQSAPAEARRSVPPPPAAKAKSLENPPEQPEQVAESKNLDALSTSGIDDARPEVAILSTAVDGIDSATATTAHPESSFDISEQMEEVRLDDASDLDDKIEMTIVDDEPVAEYGALESSPGVVDDESEAATARHHAIEHAA